MTELAVFPDEQRLEELEREVERALETASPGGLDVLGYGEISTVLRCEHEGRPFACKRLPPFPDREHVEAYARLFERYIAELEAQGVGVVPSELRVLPRDGELVVYCVQPVYPAGALLPNVMQQLDPEGALGRLEAVLDAMGRVISDRRGLDAQISNWVLDGERLLYLDVTTPLLRDETGHDELDLELFLASLPGALRPVVRRFMLSDILDKYYELRGAALDLAGNLHKEGLGELVPGFAERASRRCGSPLAADEAWRYYRSDARMWALLQRLRRVDRLWQRKVRRRVYPFLLPGKIERHV